MKKSYILIFVIVLSIFIYINSKINFFAKYPFAHFYPYHNKGTITLTIDGKQFNIDNVKLLFDSDIYFYKSDKTNKGYETSLINNNKFKFKKGAYGGNVFVFTLLHDDYQILEKNDVIIEFGHFNTNNWHIFNYDIQINIDKNEDGASVTTNQKIYLINDSDKNIVKEYIHSTNITDEQNTICFYTGP